jgi:putative photosynthetic complex assembly protein
MAQFQSVTARPTERDKIPAALLWAMAALALSALLLTSFSVLTHSPHEGVPAKGGTVVMERLLILEGLDAQAVTVRDVDSKVLMDLPHGGFVTVIQNAMERNRRVQRITGNPPMRIAQYDNGRIVAEDPSTGWSAELYAFGDQNKAAFERLLREQ